MTTQVHRVIRTVSIPATETRSTTGDPGHAQGAAGRMNDQGATAIRPREESPDIRGSGSSTGRVVGRAAVRQVGAALIVLLLVGVLSGALVGRLLASGLNGLLGSLHLG